LFCTVSLRGYFDVADQVERIKSRRKAFTEEMKRLAVRNYFSFFWGGDGLNYGRVGF
jgi:hypothetical protein